MCRAVQRSARTERPQKGGAPAPSGDGMPSPAGGPTGCAGRASHRLRTARQASPIQILLSPAAHTPPLRSSAFLRIKVRRFITCRSRRGGFGGKFGPPVSWRTAKRRHNCGTAILAVAPAWAGYPGPKTAASVRANGRGATLLRALQRPFPPRQEIPAPRCKISSCGSGIAREYA